ncbi:Regulatory protein AtoC [Phycisphaerales bacterium]|nr:Regulatory protein AtoC [Phycisphaerales bacterium]
MTALSALSQGHSAKELVLRSQSMRTVVSAIDAAARFDTTVLLLGESGVGKELAAHRLHAKSRRAEGPFVPVECTTLSEALTDSQLFGHVKGAFTGAERDSVGFVRAAEGGTLFLDEVGDLPPAAQAKLLRVLQERTVTPVGAARAVGVNIRVVAATHRDLRGMVREGKFREDLLYRLQVVRIVVPPLRDRSEDIEVVAEHLLERLAVQYGMKRKRMSAEAMEVLVRHRWPGNVRELANAMEHAFVFAPGVVVGAEHLPEEVSEVAEGVGTETKESWGSSGVVPMHVAERELISRALRQAGGMQSRAADMLQIERRRLYRKVKSYGLESLTRAGGEDGNPGKARARYQSGTRAGRPVVAERG